MLLDDYFLVGVPIQAEVKPKKFQIVSKNNTKINCEVIVSESTNYHNNKLSITNKFPSLKCASFEQVTVFAVEIPKHLSGRSRLHVFNNVCRLLLLSKGFSCDSVVIEETKKQTTSVLQTSSHYGITNKYCGDKNKIYDVTEVWWPVSCSSDPFDSAKLRPIKAAVENGSLSELSGTKVAGWKVYNRNDDKARCSANSIRTSKVVKSSQ